METNEYYYIIINRYLLNVIEMVVFFVQLIFYLKFQLFSFSFRENPLKLWKIALWSDAFECDSVGGEVFSSFDEFYLAWQQIKRKVCRSKRKALLVAWQFSLLYRWPYTVIAMNDTTLKNFETLIFPLLFRLCFIKEAMLLVYVNV